MVMIFLGTNSKFYQRAEQILGNRPVFIEWKQNVILLGQKMLLLFPCFQKRFVTNLIWKQKWKQTKMKKQVIGKIKGASLSSAHLWL